MDCASPAKSYLGMKARDGPMSESPRKPDKEPGNPWMKSLFIWAGILLALILFVQIVDGGWSRSAAAGSDALFGVPEPGRRGLASRRCRSARR